MAILLIRTETTRNLQIVVIIKALGMSAGMGRKAFKGIEGLGIDDVMHC